MAYGTAAGVASLVPRWASGGTFTAGTRPTLTEVGTWLTQVSAVLDAVLAEEGFTTPVTAAAAVSILDLFANTEVAAMADGVNGSGRFGPLPKGSSVSRWGILSKDIQDFIAAVAAGLAQVGAARPLNTGAQIGCRSTDEAGNSTFPIFQRSGFGNSFTDWDT